MPTTVVGLEKWLQELWRDKEQALDALYKQGIAQQAARYRTLNNIMTIKIDAQVY